MALEKPEVSSENRGPGFVASWRKIIFTQDELWCVCVCVSVSSVWLSACDAFLHLQQKHPMFVYSLFFLHSSNGPLESRYWHTGEDTGRQISLRQLSVPPFCWRSLLSPQPVIYHLHWGTKVIHFLKLNFIVLCVRMSWAHVLSWLCWNVLIHACYADGVLYYCQRCRRP